MTNLFFYVLYDLGKFNYNEFVFKNKKYKKYLIKVEKDGNYEIA